MNIGDHRFCAVFIWVFFYPTNEKRQNMYFLPSKVWRAEYDCDPLAVAWLLGGDPFVGGSHIKSYSSLYLI